MIGAINYTAIWAAAVTGATAMVVGLIGYFTAKLSAHVAMRQAAEETNRLREERAEKHLQHRQTLYHDLLNQDRAFFALEPYHPSAVREWRNGINDLVNGVVLFGTAEAAEAALNLHTVTMAMSGAVSDEPADTYQTRLLDVVNQHVVEWQDARMAFINAVRADSSPDRRVLLARGEAVPWAAGLASPRRSQPPDTE